MKSLWKEPLVRGEWISSSSLSPFVALIIQNYLGYSFFFSLKREESVSVKLVTPLCLCIYNVYVPGVQGFGVSCPPLPICKTFYVQALLKIQF